MKPRIMFVDDQENILDGLRRSLREMRDEWEMVFACGAHEALNQLALTRFDAVVSDMRMPGMSGAQLLKLVEKDDPRAIRIVLSGQTDQNVAFDAIRTSHQFLNKPCEPETLIGTLQRALSLRDLLASETLQSLVAGLQELPSSPAICDELTQELNSANPSLEQVGKIISRDVGLTAKVLHVASSGFFCGSRTVSSVADAAKHLGVERLRAMVQSHGFRSRYEGREVAEALAERLWDHSLVCGQLAQQVAKEEGLCEKDVESAFAAGILHDLGALVLAGDRPEAYERVVAGSAYEDEARLTAERESLGGTHAEIGAYLAELWGISETIVGAIAYHHRPSECGGSDFDVLTAVHVAEGMSQACFSGDPGGKEPNVLDFRYLTQIGVGDRLPAWASLFRKLLLERESA